MAKEIQLLDINTRLRFVLFGLECVLDVELSPAEVERVFSDAEADLAETRYVFWSGPGLEVTGYVEEYESGTLWLTVQSRRGYKPSLSAIAERAEYQELRRTKREWYSVKCIFEHPLFAQGAEATVYEERVVILRANDFDDAIRQGEVEAQQYVEGLGGDARYAGFINAYRTGEKELADKMEVYSLMRGTTLPREAFLEGVRHFWASLGSVRRCASKMGGLRDLDRSTRSLAWRAG